MGLSCKPNIYVSWSTSEWRVRLAPLNRFKPSSKIFYWPFQGGTSFVDLLCFCSLLCLLCLCARLFICALWSPAGKGLTSWLSFVVSTVSLSLSHWYPGSGVVLDCIDSWSLHPYLLKPSSKIFDWPFHGGTSFVDLLWLLWLCVRLFICALWSPAGKGLTSWLSFVVYNCEFVTFPLVSWVRYGTWLYRFPNFAPLLTLFSWIWSYHMWVLSCELLHYHLFSQFRINICSNKTFTYKIYIA